jgi:hypothetical protein
LTKAPTSRPRTAWCVSPSSIAARTCHSLATPPPQTHP